MGDQAAKILVPFVRSDQQRIAPALHASHFRADVRANADFVCSQIKLWRAIKSIAIQQKPSKASRIRSRTEPFSGEEVPSRKLKAERACSSIYISRTHRAQTIFPACRHTKNDKSPAGLVLHRKKEFPDPRRLPARVFLPTIVRKCARGRKRGGPFRSALEKRPRWACFPAIAREREPADEKRAARSQ